MTGAFGLRLVLTSAIAVAVASAFLSGSGLGSTVPAGRGMQGIPAGLATAIHARLGAGAIRPGSAARDAEQGPLFGFSVAVSSDGTTALVGAPAVAHAAGAAYVFHVSDAGSWVSSAAPTATLTLASSPVVLLGFTVALSGDGTTAFVGAPAAGSGQDRPGAIYVFHVPSADAWASSSTPTATLTAAGGINLGYAPIALSTDGTTLIAGAPYYNDTGGGAYLFHASSDTAWASTSTPTAVLTVPGESRADIYVGSAVAISGDGTTALLSDYGNPDGDGAGGGAYVYHVSAEDAWTSSAPPLGRLSDPTSGLEYLGLDVALSGDGTVAFLASFGAVDVYHASGAATWASASVPTATLSGPPGAFFGGSAAVSTDGTTALVSGVAANRGTAYVFEVPDEGSWTSSSQPAATLSDSGAVPSIDSGGLAVLSTDGASALVGAPGVHAETGAADVFHTANASAWTSSSTPAAILTVAALTRCVVPKLRGLTVSAAKSALKVRSCRLGKVRRVHAKAKKGRVVSQSRISGSRLPVGTKVGIDVAR